MSRVSLLFLTLIAISILFAQGDPHYMWGYVVNEGDGYPTAACLNYKSFVIGIPETIRYPEDPRATYNETNGGWSVQIGGLFPATGDTFVIFFEDGCESTAGSDTELVILDSMMQDMGTTTLTPFVKIPFVSKPENMNLNISPSPFNNSCEICLHGQGKVNVAIYNVLGQPVANIFSGNIAGSRQFRWVPGNIAGGIYFIQMKSISNTITKKVIFMP